MEETKPQSKRDVTCKILATVLNELNPARTVDEWYDHVIKTGDDPKAFFNGNGEGLAQYEAFTRTYDKDAHKRAMKKRRK